MRVFGLRINAQRGSQITLGALIDLLSARPPEQEVQFDFEYLEPDSLMSYRGYYDELAIGFTPSRFPDKLTVAAFLAECRAAVGETFTGYKGGDYTMDRDTPLWVANYGNAGSTAVVGLCDCEYRTVIKTEWVND